MREYGCSFRKQELVEEGKGGVGLGWVGSSFTEPTGGMRTGGWWSLVVLNGVNDRLLNCIFEFSTLVVFAKLNEIILLA